MSKLELIKGIGPVRKELLKKLAIENCEELAFHLPSRYEDRREVNLLSQSLVGEELLFYLSISNISRPISLGGRQSMVRLKAFDSSGQCELIYFNDIYSPRKLTKGRSYYFYGKLDNRDGSLTLVNPKILGSEDLGLVPVYPTTQGLSQRMLRGFILRALEILNLKETLPQWLIEKRSLVSTMEALEHIHRPKDYKEIIMARKSLEYRECFTSLLSMRYLRDLGREPKEPYRNLSKINDFIKALPFNLTDGQLKSIEDIVSDTKSGKPMNRMIQGDVGSGKTVVGLAGLVLAAGNGKQGAFLAPTEVLASQHYQNFYELLNNLGLVSALLTGSTGQAERREIHSGLVDGSIDIIFGTHALLEEKLVFKDLDFALVDEQHRFGVSQRAALGSKGQHPHYLSMSATPIPRSLAMTIYSGLDLSTIESYPAGRGETKTYAVGMGYEDRVLAYLGDRIKDSRIFIVVPMIEEDEDLGLENIQSLEEKIQKVLPEARYATIHGRMSGLEKAQAIDGFSRGELNLLISTTVIEVGIDVPEANIILIYNAERFGLAQLHQLRGRVGRGSEDGVCILMAASNSEAVRSRMEIMVKSNDGFEIAEKDLELRGPGMILGFRQHGLEWDFDKVNQETLEEAWADAMAIDIEEEEDLLTYLEGRVGDVRGILN